mmetsp:Transcript_18277/g.31267  ORF Transcript_18277/g.31267 Transcript_18277/m.31267 type:complete len:107 (+) Transcript_18277:152-472(+)|eukprot:CAMPEP_0168624698 /NCGR_PEP_ID=MMETSP0449_2-20121227/9573_1 /TAXON_ID=1082188 /ORGANISM="Strombidium rassoulzadegani, Strain ras09" /LENGTH=106 /DNA_ID=CAMNT_0008666315 /DNA_START=137 /DNA_END=457 /DNA_ORIENTATION=+
MIEKAYEKVDELKQDKQNFPFSQNPKYQLEGRNYFKLMQADCHKLPFKDDKFDTVVDTFGLESCYDPEMALKEMKRVCRPGGHIILISRGLSFWGIYNKWLQIRAA